MGKDKKEIEKRELIKALTKTQFSHTEFQQTWNRIRSNAYYEEAEIQHALVELSRRSAEAREAVREIDIILKLEKTLLKKISDISENFDSAYDEFLHTTLAFDILQRQLLSLPVKTEFDVQIDVQFSDEMNFKNEFDAFTALSHFISNFSVPLKFLLKKIDHTSSVDISEKKLQAACLHFSLASEWNIFHEQKSIWKHGCSSVSFDGDKVFFDSSKSPTLAAFRVSLTRLRVFRKARSTDKLIFTDFKKNTSDLPPKGFRSKEEITSYYLTQLQYYSPELKESIHGAMLCEWIRAYTIIKEAAQDHIFSSSDVSGVDNLILKGSEKHFQELMQAGGIPKKQAETIIQHLIFSSSSRDILDTPFIRLGNDLALIPAVAIQIAPEFSTESLLKNIKGELNRDVSIIGPGLEGNVRLSLTSGGIHSKKINRKNRFDCDVAFIFDETLFLCECKGKYQVSDFRSYIDLEKFLREDTISQHTRTCDFFISNLQHIRYELGLPSNWTPNRIIKLIITSAKLGRTFFDGDFLILDENIFHGFFNRYSPRRVDSNGNIEKVFSDHRLSDTLTFEKFLSFASSPPSISYNEERKKEREFIFETDIHSVIFRDVECYGEIEVRSAA